MNNYVSIFDMNATLVEFGFPSITTEHNMKDLTTLEAVEYQLIQDGIEFIRNQVDTADSIVCSKLNELKKLAKQKASNDIDDKVPMDQNEISLFTLYTTLDNLSKQRDKLYDENVYFWKQKKQDSKIKKVETLYDETREKVIKLEKRLGVYDTVSCYIPTIGRNENRILDCMQESLIIYKIKDLINNLDSKCHYIRAIKSEKVRIFKETEQFPTMDELIKEIMNLYPRYNEFAKQYNYDV